MEHKTTETTSDSSRLMEVEIGGKKYVMKTYYMGFLKKGDKWSAESTEETKKIQEGHLDHMRKMGEAGKLKMAGPFLEEFDIRGIVIYDVNSKEEALELANQDPAVRSGRLKVEIYPWMTEKGTTLD